MSQTDQIYGFVALCLVMALILLDQVRRSRKWKARAMSLQRTFDSAVEGILVLDSKGRILSFSLGAELLFGFRFDEVQGKNIDSLISGLNLGSFESPKSMAAWREFEAKRKNGDLIPVSVSIGEAREEEQRRFIVIVQDLTAVMEIKGELRTKNEVIEHQNAQLKQFTSIISHELRTPIAIISAASENLENPDLWTKEDVRKNIIRIIQKNIYRLGRMIDDVLEISHLESGKFICRMKKVSVHTFFVHVMPNVLQLAEGAKKKVDLQLDPMPSLYGDADLLEQVVLNLVNNAIRYATQTIGISSKLLEDKGEKWVQIMVTDDGPGVPPSERERIFEKFVQVDRKTGGGYKGTGLGLSICREILKHHEGRIWVEGEEGHGAKFILRVPAFDAMLHSEESATVQ